MMFDGSHSAFGWLWLAAGAALIGFIAGLILFVVGRSAADDPGAILARRLARGEIAPDEYDRMREALGTTARGDGMARLGAALAVGALRARVSAGREQPQENAAKHQIGSDHQPRGAPTASRDERTGKRDQPNGDGCIQKVEVFPRR